MTQFIISLIFSIFMMFGAILSSSEYHLCHSQEALSLLQFKEDMLDINSSSSEFDYPKMIFWNRTSIDCCTWDGVTCHEFTGFVIGLDLSCSRLRGVINHNSSLFLLPHLQKLNLAYNDFRESEISHNFRGLSSLTHLNLSSSYFQGIIPSILSHLSKLVLLDLSNFNLRFDPPRDFHILLRNLTHIRVLSLGYVNISTTLPTNWSSSLTYLNLRRTGVHGKLSNSIFHLPRLQSLLLSSNDHLSVALGKSNFSNTPPLQVLDLSYTNCSSDGTPDLIGSFSFLRSLTLIGSGLSGSFPNSIGNLSQIIFLGLSHNNFTGNIPMKFSNLLPKLETLYLSFNYFSGQFPYDIGNLTDLTELFLAGNSFSGPLPSNVSGLQKLVRFDLSYNAFDGTIPFWLFSIPSLEWLNLEDNQLDSLVSPNRSHFNKLRGLSLSNNKLSLNENKINNNSFPSLEYLSLSSSGITEFPHFLRTSQHLTVLDLSNNKLSGRIPDWIPWDSLQYVNLSQNSLSSLGSFFTSPLIKNLTTLDLSSNNFQEPLPLSINSSMQNFMSFIDLSNNNFNGTISMTFPKGNQLRFMNLNGNLLEGSLPRSLSNCKYLQFLDLGNNKINDTFPTFFEDLEELQVLILKSNRFFGNLINLKTEKFLPKLRILDLSFNEFIGVLPVKLFKSFKAMISSNNSRSKASYMEPSGFYFPRNIYHYSISFTMKGNIVKLTQILTTLVAIDLSSNNFTGDIPEVIGNLSSLVWLNLSHNKFSGHIPSALGELHFLQSLDLSWNQLEGEIPHKLGDISFLGFLNLSRNHLVGRIPEGKQFNTFMNDSYFGNLRLCGFPMTKDCGEMDSPSPLSQGPYQDDDDSSFWSEFTWKSVCIGYGFGFAIGSLVFFIGKPKWLVRNIEELCWYGLLFLVNKSRTRGPKQTMKAIGNVFGM